jgi:L-aspartate oxidase
MSTGDGISVAARAGAQIRNMEFIQFHPTALFSEKIREKYGRLFLVSESVRGEGGILRNSKGEAFMDNLHPMKDLAPRDVVAKAVFDEMQKENQPNVYLDITHKSKEYLENRFPNIYSVCLEVGIDISKDLIPVTPAAHFTIGGIKTDLNGRTNIDNLFACGECSSTGVHGANRLACNSLLEGLVFGARTARSADISIINSNINEICLEYSENTDDKLSMDIDWNQIKNRIRNIMNDKVGIIRYEDKMLKAKDEIFGIIDSINNINSSSPEHLEIKNIAQCGSMIIDNALKRKESLGSHQVFKKEINR